ncbi:MAG: lipopolysaccharide heptosyltransferase II [Phycisphaerales bacterium]|nr:MAG: lipopolysaccharide heptosyltransferase II [Phycisphaerales bacterium]
MLPADVRSILVVLPTWVGDFVMATPFLRGLRRHFAQGRITFLAEPNLRELIEGGEWMDEVVEWPDRRGRQLWRREFRSLIARLRAGRFEAAVLLPNKFRAALIARLAGARRRIGFDRDGRGWLLTDRVPVRNRAGRRFVPYPLVEYYADLAEALGMPRCGHELELYTTSACEASLEHRLKTGATPQSPGIHAGRDRLETGVTPRVVISPGAKYGAAKCWLPERFAAVGDRLAREYGATVIVTCGPGEEHIARAIGGAMQEENILFDEPRLSLGELKVLVKSSNLLLCNDAGPRHFARAFGVPVVTVFGPTHPEWTRTDYPHQRIVRIDVDCGPCQQRVCPLGHLKCMTGVSVEAVYAACVELLQSPHVQEFSI